jgi:hypothetical protein
MKRDASSSHFTVGSMLRACSRSSSGGPPANEKHLTSEYFQSQLKLLPELGSEGPEGHLLRGGPRGDPEKGSLAEHARSRLDDVVIARHAVRRSSHSTSVVPA